MKQLNHKSPESLIKYLSIVLFVIVGFSLDAMEATPALLREKIENIQQELALEQKPEARLGLEEALQAARTELNQLEALARQQEAMRQERGKAPSALLVQAPVAGTFNLRIENKNTEPIYVGVIGRKAPQAGSSWLISYATSYVYSDEFLIPSQEIKALESVTLSLPKESQVYQRWLCWDTKPLTGTKCSSTVPLENHITEDEKVISLMTPERAQALELERQQLSALSAEKFNLHLTNKNLEPVYVALVGRKAPSGYVAGPLSYLTRMVYTDDLLTKSQEIKPSETITIAVPKETDLYQRWLCWDNKPITSTSCSSTIPLDNRIIEDEKTVEIISPERQHELDELLLKEKLVALRSDITVVQPEQIGAAEKEEGEETYLLKIRNLDIKPLNIALIAGIAPTRGMAWAGSFVSSWYYRALALTDSLTVEPMKSITLRVPKTADIDSLWLFYDEKPIECKNESCKGSYQDLGVVVKEDKKTVKIMTKERREYLNKAAQRLILKRNIEPAAQNTATSTKRGDALPMEETMAIEKRDSIVFTALPKILGSALAPQQKVPKIGLALSGGGLRAMFSGLGFTLGLRNAGIINAISYTSGLSGSTWFLMKWLEQGGDPSKLDEIAQTLKESMAKGLVPKQLLDPVTKELSNWSAFKELALGGVVELDPNFNAQFKASLICPNGVCTKTAPSMIDLWGYFLGRRLFKGKDNKYQFTLSSLKDTALKAQMPIPIFTAVDSQDTKTYIDSMIKYAWSNHEQEPPKDYKWFEATPFNTSIRGLKGTYEIPQWGLGRKYDRSGLLTNALSSVKEPSYNFEPFLFTKPQESKPVGKIEDYYRIEPGVPQLLGAFGGAFTVSLGEIAKMMETTLHGVASNLELVALGARTLGTVVPAVGALSQLGVLGGVVRNVSSNLITSDKDRQFFDGLELYDFAKGGNKQLHLRDAGVFYNLPLPALFDERRNLDVIIVHDTSGDLHEMQQGTPMVGSELAKFKLYPQYAGKRFPQELRDDARFKTKMDELYSREKLLAVFNDPRQRGYNPDEITLIYIPTISHPAIEALKISPTEKFGTFKLQYEEAESQELMNYSKALAEQTEQEIKDVIKSRTLMMNA